MQILISENWLLFEAIFMKILQYFNSNISSLFENGFPESVLKDFKHVISMISRESFNNSSIEAVDGYNSDNEWYMLSDGTQIKFPYRLYLIDNLHVYPRLTDLEKKVYDCMFTRSCDGYIREKHIRNILMTEIPEWCFPYILRSSADYAVEIVTAIYEMLSQRDNTTIQAFCRANPDLVRVCYRRMCSYWNEYYRTDNPQFELYVGRKLFSECLSPGMVFEKFII